MKDLLLKLNNIAVQLEEAGFVVEADACHDVFIKVAAKKKKSKKNVPTNPELYAKCKSEIKSKFDVYPSAYANGYAVQVCKGTKPGLDGKKRCSAPYC
jgi:hypothetical protein